MKPPSLPLESINHVARATNDLDASLAFYRDVLGFRPIHRPDFGFPGAWLCNYGLQIHLIAASSDQAIDDREISIRTDHIAFHTQDSSVVEDLLQAHGIPYKSNYVADSGVTQFFFHDPDGNHIEIGSYSPIRKMDGD
jgi:catechol 2,3-dioxygenase-like lactoylglutathione lyase family enzyme